MNIKPININEREQFIALSTSSQSVEFTGGIYNIDTYNTVVLYNSSTYDVYVESGAAAPTVVFPATAQTEYNGTVIPAGASQTFGITNGHKFISAISTATDGRLYIKVGEGV